MEVGSESCKPKCLSFSNSTSRGLGSGMDSRSGSDDNDDDGDNTLPPSLHGAGDGSNDSIGRPGLEGANSDVEDPPVLNRTSLGTSVRQETQGLGKICVCSLAKIS